MTNIAKPTPEMIEAGKGALLMMLRAPAHNGEPLDYALTVESIYTAMVASAPQEPDEFRALIGRGTKIGCQDCQAWARWQDEALALLSTQEPVADDDALIERLRSQAQSASKASKMLADAKTARQTDGGGPYGYVAPEQTLEWQAADAIERLQAKAPETDLTDIQRAGRELSRRERGGG